MTDSAVFLRLNNDVYTPQELQTTLGIARAPDSQTQTVTGATVFIIEDASNQALYDIVGVNVNNETDSDPNLILNGSTISMQQGAPTGLVGRQAVIISRDATGNINTCLLYTSPSPRDS